MPVIGTAGHVDHGKSALVHRLTGIDPDRFAEEKRRGLTIDLGFAWVTLPSGAEIGMVDVPGHERFIKNMLAGAGSVGACLFVVAANEGWKPQSAEHLAVLDILDIRDGVIAVTKADLVDDAQLAARRAEVRARLEPSSLRDAPIVAVSAHTGAGIDELVAALDELVARSPGAADEKRPRMWIDRVFSMAGSGTVVTGTLAGGRLVTGAEVEVLPAGARARIRSLQSHRSVHDEVGPGTRVAANLAGLDRHSAQRGDALVEPGWWRTTRTVDAELRVIGPAISGARFELGEKGAFLFHCGSAETPARLRLMTAPRIGPGEKGLARLELRSALPLKRGDRFVLRDAGRATTIGGGIVLDPAPRPGRVSDPALHELLYALNGAGADTALGALVRAQGSLPQAEALWRAGADAGAIPADVIAWGPDLYADTRAAELTQQAVEVLEAHHVSHPLERGLAREALRAALSLSAEALDGLLGATAAIVADGASVRLSSHRVTLDDEQERTRGALLEKLDDARFAPAAARDLDADPTLLRALVDAGDIVAIEDFFLTSARALEARAVVRAEIERAGPLTVAQIRDLLGTTRRYAVPLCEWLDRTGATIRKGDLRDLGPRS